MECPKCGRPSEDAAAECACCGVIFAKLRERPAIEPPAASAVAAATTAWPVTRIVRAAVLIALLAWTWQFASAGMGVTAQESFLHLPNLVFHEAGHVLFGFFGRFMTVLGGSLFQVVVPVICAVAFVRQGNPFGAAVCAWWAGENLLDLAPYIGDARALQLVLLGGHTGAEVEGHDWEFLLSQLGWLHKDVALALAAHRIGLAIMVAAIVWGVVLLVQNQPEPAVALDEI